MLCGLEVGEGGGNGKGVMGGKGWVMLWQTRERVCLFVCSIVCVYICMYV